MAVWDALDRADDGVWMTDGTIALHSGVELRTVRRVLLALYHEGMVRRLRYRLAGRRPSTARSVWVWRLPDA